MEFSFKEGATLRIEDPKIKELVSKILSRPFSKEDGGILLGSFDPALNEYRVAAFTYPTKREDCSAVHFVRQKDAANKAIKDAWEKSDGKVNYLGEWHTHNEVNPHPSGTDMRLMQTIVEDGNCVFDRTFMLIFGHGGGVFCAMIEKDGDGTFAETARSEWKQRLKPVPRGYWDHGCSSEEEYIL